MTKRDKPYFCKLEQLARNWNSQNCERAAEFVAKGAPKSAAETGAKITGPIKEAAALF